MEDNLEPQERSRKQNHENIGSSINPLSYIECPTSGIRLVTKEDNQELQERSWMVNNESIGSSVDMPSYITDPICEDCSTLDIKQFATDDNLELIERTLKLHIENIRSTDLFYLKDPRSRKRFSIKYSVTGNQAEVHDIIQGWENLGFRIKIPIMSQVDYEKMKQQALEKRKRWPRAKRQGNFSAGREVTQPTSSGDSFQNGDNDVQFIDNSGKNHQMSLSPNQEGNLDLQERSSLQDNPSLFFLIDPRSARRLLVKVDVLHHLRKWYSHGYQVEPVNEAECRLLSRKFSVGWEVTQPTSSGDTFENGDIDVQCSDNSDKNHQMSLSAKQILWSKFKVDQRYKKLLLPNLSKEEKIVFVLDMVRRREIFEYNSKAHRSLPTRFCQFNIAFFDLDKESDFKREPRSSKIPDSFWGLDSSINIISIKVAESDVPFPINIYGTVLARDEVDYRCVYLFNRGKDNPQRITSMEDALTLTGPYRALVGLDHMFFEFNLKIKGEEGAVDKDFSKGLMERNCTWSPDQCCQTLSLESCLSQVEMEFTHVPFALEASIEVNILNARSCFHGKITAGSEEILLYDSRVAGTETKLRRGGSVPLTRRVVAVPWGSDLVLKFSARMAKPKSIHLECNEDGDQFKLGNYEMEMKVSWMAMLRKHRANVLKEIGRALVIL